MFDANMIAPCGLDCSICKRTLAETCPACGGIICVHTGVCSGCGRQYNNSMNR
jgi:rRNA maturation protein Nop10